VPKTSPFEEFGTVQGEETPITRTTGRGGWGTHCAEATLKKLDLEFSVDCLFKKTRADFDEGGVHGLLMNHPSLGVGIDGRSLGVMSYASDAVVVSGDDEEGAGVEPVETVDSTER
jgi:condensin complex subunit 2